MKVVGIIAEYNPFHNGHKYHMEQAKALTGADRIVVVMSGNYTQRGNPALIDKYARAEMALMNGADLVLELPLYYACTSAEYFAKGAVILLDKLGIVDTLCFGSECGDISILSKIADALCHPSDNFDNILTLYLKSGKTFPQARALALEESIPDLYAHTAILSSPNNILGIEYMKALILRNSKIVPYTNLRVGAAYHEKRLQEHNSSAIAIRHSLADHHDLRLIEDQVPPSVYAIMQKHFNYNFPIFTDDLSSLLHYKLLLDAPAGYTDYIDVSEDLSARILNRLHEYKDFSSFCERLKTKEMTYARISRCLLHILLNIRKDRLSSFLNEDAIFYARMLGFRKEATALLSLIKQHSSIPLISKLADAYKIIDSTTGLAMLEEEISASHIYNTIINTKYHYSVPNEYSQNIIIIP